MPIPTADAHPSRPVAVLAASLLLLGFLAYAFIGLVDAEDALKSQRDHASLWLDATEPLPSTLVHLSEATLPESTTATLARHREGLLLWHSVLPESRREGDAVLNSLDSLAALCARGGERPALATRREELLSRVADESRAQFLRIAEQGELIGARAEVIAAISLALAALFAAASAKRVLAPRDVPSDGRARRRGLPDGGDAPAEHMLDTESRPRDADLEKRLAESEETGRWLRQNLTRQEDLNRQLEHAISGLKKANREIRTISYCMSHDFRSPLLAIRRLCDWISEDASGALSEEARENLLLLQNRVRRMELLLDGMQAYFEAGRSEYAVEEVDSGRLVSEVSAALNVPEGFEIEIDEGLPVFRTARTPLRLVLMHLIDNALKHHDRSEGKVRVHAHDAGDCWEFRVSDDGPGIPRHQRKKAVELFGSLKADRDRKGAGAGLAIVNRVLERVGTRVNILTAFSGGTSVSFSWPKEWVD